MQKLPQSKQTLIGIIDDGCPFARSDLLGSSGTRVVGIWDQDQNPAFGSNAMTTPPEDWQFGSQIVQA